jgi:hypothetical protein
MLALPLPEADNASPPSIAIRDSLTVGALRRALPLMLLFERRFETWTRMVALNGYGSLALHRNCSLMQARVSRRRALDALPAPLPLESWSAALSAVRSSILQ